MKRLFKIIFFVSLAVILSVSVFVVFSAVASINSHSGSVGIIGGADGPTAIYITSSLIFSTPIFWLLCIAVVGLIASAIVWAVVKRK